MARDREILATEGTEAMPLKVGLRVCQVESGSKA